MWAVLRPLATFLAILVLFRLAGKRQMSQVSPFDLVMLLIISETVSNALLAWDDSVTGALIAVMTFLVADIMLSHGTQRSPRLKRFIEDDPAYLFKEGSEQRERMKGERIEMSEILEAARLAHGIERLDQIKSAVLEPTGHISIIPLESKG
jgi:uncharacterized membrane protein YcaP (DUF421 family)